MPEPYSLESRIRSCIVSAKGWKNADVQPIERNKHLVFDYGLDSLEFQKLQLELENEFLISIPNEDMQSGFFTSLDGISTYLVDYHWESIQ